MSIAARLTNNGNLLVNGSFDENTSISLAKFRINANTGYAGTFNEVTDMIVTNGLLLYVNGSSDVYSGSGTTWSDLSTYNNNATLTNSPTYNVSTGGGSFAFNGSTQYAPVTAALLNTTYTGKTVFFVGRLNSAAWTPGVNQFRAMFGSASAPRNFNFYVFHDAANLIYFHYSTTGSSFITNSVSLNTNTWFIAAVTQDATTSKVYLNGTEVYSVAGQTLNQYANGGEEAVAKADNYWYGDVAVCALYSRALSAAEILNNYNAFAARVGLTPTSNSPVGRDSSDGTMYVTGIFDEFTGAPVVDSSLQLWLDAGQTASYSGTGSTWTDLSSAGNNGTLVNSPTYSSTNGGSLEFNGTNNYINVPSTSSLQFLNRAPYSFEVWVYPIADNSASYPGFINRESNPGTGRDGYNLYYTNLGVAVGSHLISTERFCTGTQVSSGATYTDAVFFNNWQCYCATYDGTTLSFYRNGVFVSSATSTGNITNTTQNLTIGQRSGVYSNSKISTTRFYNRALSADEALTNFNALRGRYGI